MKFGPVFCAGITPACIFLKEYLQSLGIPLVPDCRTDVRHVILDVPYRPVTLPDSLPEDAVIWTGNPGTVDFGAHPVRDLLQDPCYVAENAAITAECAIQIAMSLLPITIAKAPVLIIGWGRIGKCLAQKLLALGADVTIAARKKKDRAMAHALGYHAVSMEELPLMLPHFRLLYNTAPEPVLEKEELACCKGIKIDLASRRGLPGEDVLWARGLPGIHAPQSSGELIAKTFIRLAQEESL